uniref:KID domain-containing protein n=1 Tax=Ascaris lumbricoides TaxID=6252 RepID=A0A0M3I7J6_ASCLU
MNEASEPCKSSVASQMTTVVVSSAHGPENQVEIQYSDVKNSLERRHSFDEAPKSNALAIISTSIPIFV